MNAITMPRLERKEAGDDAGDVTKLLEDLTNETKRALDRSGAETREVKTALDKLEDHVAKMEAKFNRPGAGGANGASGANVGVERKAFGAYIASGSDAELKALDTETGPTAGYLVNTEMSKTINKKIFDQSPIRRLATIQTLTEGDGWEEPIDFSDLGAEWIGERESRPETDNPDVGMLTIPLHEIYAHQTVTQKLLDLSFVDIGAWIEGKIADKFGRSEGAAYVSGNGVKKPRGFMDYPVSSAGDATRDLWKLQYTVSGTAAGVADANGQANGIKDLYWALRAPYRQNATWLMNSATANAIDKLKDQNNNYIWRDGMQAGSPPSLLGRPVEFDENMPDIGANLFPIAFGDFRTGYKIIDHAGIKPLRDPYSNKPNVIFYVYKRTGGAVANSEAIKLLKCST